jgi:5-formyltetrahydrofolate cyclo-ligase
MDPLAMDKVALRAWARERRAAFADLSPTVCGHLAGFLKARGIARVLAYRALPGEISLDALEPDFELYTTRAIWKPEPRLTVHAWASATEPSRFGVLEPPRDAPQVERERVQAVLLPGLAFDRSGLRLGYGGGFYDRLLEEWAVLTVGVIPSALVLDALPGEPHDVRVAFLATEAGLHPTKTARRPN